MCTYPHNMWIKVQWMGAAGDSHIDTTFSSQSSIKGILPTGTFCVKITQLF